MSDVERQYFILHLEVDSGGRPVVEPDHALIDTPDMLVKVLDDDKEGHGFGLAEVLTIAVSVGAGVASDLIASSIKSSVKAVIRRVKGRGGDDGDGTIDGMTRVVESERKQKSDDSEV
ncbi:hypothetical protein [Saccharothrix sp. ALI-22-I]|uniref:hypothetical protein n=1 Tax=Saccharothrix sp. ALI-22-I TaxID=1933778 RepID=UPI00117B2AE0|nr:hypothetical protein [Saccharothrix sp. ALI-22-I]